MYMYLTSESGERVQFSLLPDRVNVRTTANIIASNIVNLGEVKIPRGSNLTGYSWNGTFLGEHAKSLGFVTNWAAPSSMISTLRSWMESGATLTFLITDITVNDEVFIESFEWNYAGGMGDVSYSIVLTKRRTLSISTIPPPATVPPDTTDTTTDPAAQSKTYGSVRLNNKNSHLNVRQKRSTSSKIIGKLNHGEKVELLGKKGNWYTIPYSKGVDGKGYVYSSYIKTGSSSGKGSSASKKKSSSSSSSKKKKKGGATHTVRNGETLYAISKKYYGTMYNAHRIYNANKSAIDAKNKGLLVSKYRVVAGMRLRIPAI